LRLEPVTRWLAGLGPALLVAGWLVWVVVPVAIARFKLDQATVRLEQAMLLLEQPELSTRSLERVQGLIADAEAELQLADEANPNSAPIWVETAWLHLEQSLQDPVQFDTFSQEAEEAARRAVALAPSAPEPRVTLGLACLINNRMSEAETQIRQALDLAPNDPYVQYYAVAVLALDPASRAQAKQLVEVVENSRYPERHVKKLEAALAWGTDSKVPLDGLRQRPLPPRYVAPEPWPSVEGLPRGTAAAAPPPPSTTKPAKPAATPDTAATEQAPGSVAPQP
jgi:tetratricopeptide (TPR) repeat protein